MQPLNTAARSFAVVSNGRLKTYNVDLGGLELLVAVKPSNYQHIDLTLFERSH